jgi:Flp pilus assembly protein TadD
MAATETIEGHGQGTGAKGLDDFRTGLTRLRDGKLYAALAHFQRACDQDSSNAFYISYKGLLLARVERRFSEGVRLCEDALRMKRNHAQLYINLAEVFVAADRKEDALEVLRLGMANTGRDARLQAMLNRFGRRRPPVIPFFERANFLNRSLGLVRHLITQKF